jgi:hypothetical protein
VLDTARICDTHPTLLARHIDMVTCSPFVRFPVLRFSVAHDAIESLASVPEVVNEAR